MTDFPEGAPCWADAMFTDVEGAKTFYGEVLGWTFGDAASEYGNYTQAFHDGKAVAAVVPPMPGGEEPVSQWTLYFASPDVAGTAEKIKAAGGDLVMEPMQVGTFGSMAIAREPSGAVFGVWQPGDHKGFEQVGEPGSYCWAELATPDPGTADAFLTQVFPYGSQRMQTGDEPVAPGMDYRAFSLGAPDNWVLGRMTTGAGDGTKAPARIRVYFAVDDCDQAVARAIKLGGQALGGPMDSPFGRFAELTDQQGAVFVVIDPGTRVGEVPQMS
ncbi:VOC family protein [Streptacidiphilus pinicola]|uniref:VOC family protein n=1 Tax=Streptacidiphilus pinicola TaxID=2219663 RepID=A0A2X0JYF5_9ACTN|nr:VOC family protein [Streptacidiphilus pinicola]RAG81985.1 VOC family protein [Streptacidiphilus pinicola]